MDDEEKCSAAATRSTVAVNVYSTQPITQPSKALAFSSPTASCSTQMESVPEDAWEQKRCTWARYILLSMYRRLFSLVFLGDVAVFVVILVRDRVL